MDKTDVQIILAFSGLNKRKGKDISEVHIFDSNLHNISLTNLIKRIEKLKEKRYLQMATFVGGNITTTTRGDFVSLGLLFLKGLPLGIIVFFVGLFNFWLGSLKLTWKTVTVFIIVNILSSSLYFIYGLFKLLKRLFKEK